MAAEPRAGQGLWAACMAFWLLGAGPPVWGGSDPGAEADETESPAAEAGSTSTAADKAGLG